MKQDFVRTFANLELFRDLSAEDLEKFLAECQEEQFDPQVVIFREGDLPDRFYVLLEGYVEIWKDYETPHADILAIRGSGACFGEMSLIDELPRSATALTTTAVRAVTLKKPHFRKVMEQNPSVALLIMKTVSQMVRVSNEAFQYGLRQKNIMLEKAYDELKKAQEDLIRSERLTTLGKFASMIIHDLRNPLSIVKGYAEILSVSAADPVRVATMATKLLGEADRLNRMVGELLDYSRGNIRLSLGPILVRDLFQLLERQFSEVLSARKIELQMVNNTEKPLLLDVDRMLRVFANLIDNAKKAMKDGGTLTFIAAQVADEIVVSVADTGEGMDEATRARLFEPFFSASSSGGTGLGMLVVSNVVEAHEGQIEVTSQKGEGTKVTIRLPLRLKAVT